MSIRPELVNTKKQLSLARVFITEYVLAQTSFFHTFYTSREGFGESTHLLGLV